MSLRAFNSIHKILDRIPCPIYAIFKCSVKFTFKKNHLWSFFGIFFHLNRHMEFSDGPNTELGGVSIQKRKEVDFPHAKHHSHPKDWNQTWFYCQNTAPAGENPLPGYRPHRLSNGHPLTQRLTAKEQQTYDLKLPSSGLSWPTV